MRLLFAGHEMVSFCREFPHRARRDLKPEYAPPPVRLDSKETFFSAHSCSRFD